MHDGKVDKTPVWITLACRFRPNSYLCPQNIFFLLHQILCKYLQKAVQSKQEIHKWHLNSWQNHTLIKKKKTLAMFLCLGFFYGYKRAGRTTFIAPNTIQIDLYAYVRYKAFDIIISQINLLQSTKELHPNRFLMK